MLDAIQGLNAPPLESLAPDVARAGFKRMIGLGPPNPGPQDVAARDLTVAGGEGPVGARLYTPPDAADPGPGIVFYHGGGWVIGDLDTHDSFCRKLAKGSRARVMSVDYRLAPEHPFPAPHDDALAASHWAFDHADEIGFDPARIALAGDSAGGNLAASVALSLRDAGRRPAFQALLYPVVDTARDTDSYRRLAEGYGLTRSAMGWFVDQLFAGGGDRSDSRVRLAGRPDLAGACPAFVSIAGFDPLHDEGRAYAEALQAAGVAVELRDYPSFNHGFYGLTAIAPAVNAAVDALTATLRLALN